MFASILVAVTSRGSVDTTLTRARGGLCWVAQDSAETIIGTLTMSTPPSDALRALTGEADASGRAWLNQIAVSPKSQRTGIATHLWGIGLEWARRRGVTAIGVDTAAPAAELVRLYRSWGFEQRDLIHWPGKTYDSVVMIRAV